MTKLRQTLFLAWMYGSLVILGLVFSPVLLMGERRVIAAMKLWTRTVLWGLRTIMGVRVEVRGEHNLATGAALIAAKHQSMLDTVAPFALIKGPAFVLKKELLRLPIFGWYCKAAGLIPVDREAHATALKQLVRDSRAALAKGRRIIIFPEGTRQAVGAPPDYKPGVAALYRDLGQACVPMATNSGEHWPAHGSNFTPGTVVFEFLDPIPAGLKRPEFMRELQARIETASSNLVGERL
jgi:1-acyl-sn-glycerol-3-phosphate acyltransferase